MKGDVWENSTGVRKEVRGDDDVEDIGDEGPSAEGNTKEWDVFAEFLVVRVPSEGTDVSESGTVVVGSSREVRLAALTDKPASCNDHMIRIWSAMLPSDQICIPFPGGGERL